MNSLHDLVNQAMADYDAGRFQQAVEHYQQALIQAPTSPELQVNLANAYTALNDEEQAMIHFTQALSLRSDYAEAYYNQGLALAKFDRNQEAQESYRQAIVIKPDFYQAHLNLANLYRTQGQTDLALGHYRTVIKHQPNHVKGLISLATLLRSQGQSEDALPLLARAQQQAPGNAEIYEHLGQCCADLCRFEDARKCFQQWVTLRPDNASAHCCLGAAWNLLGHYDQAIEQYSQAIALDPNYASARWNRTLLYLAQGQWQKGWQDYPQRYRLDAIATALPHDYPQPRWDGTRFDGQTLLVHHEQGLGDIIQFLRYLPQVKQMGGRVLLESPKTILSLVQDWDCIDQGIPTQKDQPVQQPFDLVTSLMDLPALFQTTEKTASLNVPYIQAHPDKARRWAHHFTQPGRKIGLVWAGGAVHHQRVAALKQRACRLEHLQPLSLIDGICLYGLQKGPGEAEVLEPGNQFLLENLGPACQDFADTAAVISHLDLVITVDTSVAHLAGAMGKTTWIMLKYDADWRWLLERDDSPWYPSVRLFRQGRNEGWPAVVQRIARALAEL